MEFFSPVHYGDSVDMDVVVENVGRSSVRMRYEGSVGGKPVFQGRTTAVLVDLKTFKSTPLPDWMRERFQAAMP